MRQISPASLQKLSESQGTEPVNLIAVQWAPNVRVFYADRAFPGIAGRILDISNIEDVINITKSSNTSAITVKLDDSDNNIKGIFNAVDIHLCHVDVYQWFADLPIAEAFIIFQGQINSPITWKEGERTLSFEVVSKLYAQEVGFSAEQGDFEYVPPKLIGKAWPLPFGTPQIYPALAVNELPAGLTAQENYKQNKTANPNDALLKTNAELSKKISEAWTKCFWCFEQAENVRIDAFINRSYVDTFPAFFNGNSIDTAFFNPKDVVKFTNLHSDWINKANQYQEQANQYMEQQNQIAGQIFQNNSNAAKAVEQNKFKVLNGDQFPQGINTSINIGGVSYTGQFAGNQFTVLSSASPFDTSGATLAGPTTVSDKAVATAYTADTNAQQFLYMTAGSGVNPGANDATLYYIAAILHVNVIGVFAKYGGVITAVNPVLYQVQIQDFGPFDTTYIVFPTALKILDSRWDDTVYVTVTSPVGPIATDIMIWLISEYTDFSWDNTSFAAARAFLVNYPMNFVLQTKKDIIKLLQEIAFQSKCAIWLKNGIFYVKYLPNLSSPNDTITEHDIEFGTLEISCTPTEELVTKYTGNWQDYGYRTPPNLVIMKYNLQKYGLIEKTDTYYCYNNVTLVELTMLYWLIRWTNTWKRIKFSTFLTKLNLETFDTVVLDLPAGLVANGAVNCLVESALYDSANNRIEMVLWAPVRFGEMAPYAFAYTAGMDPTLIFGLDDPVNTTNTAAATPSGKLYPQKGTSIKTTRPKLDHVNISPSDVDRTPVSTDIALDPNQISNGNGNVQGVDNSQWQQYIIKPVVDVNLTADTPGCWPGVVKTQSGNTNDYNVDVYFDGIEKDPTVVTVKQYQINPDDTIPEGTACLVIRNKIVDDFSRNTGFPVSHGEYTMFVPVWLQDPKTAEDDPHTGGDEPGTGPDFPDPGDDTGPDDSDPEEPDFDSPEGEGDQGDEPLDSQPGESGSEGGGEPASGGGDFS